MAGTLYFHCINNSAVKKFLFIFGFLISLQGFSQCYSVAPITYAPDSFNLGTTINATMDDNFSPMIQMPFSFCYFGNVYNRLTIGSNRKYNKEYYARLISDRQNRFPVINIYL